MAFQETKRIQIIKAATRATQHFPHRSVEGSAEGSVEEANVAAEGSVLPAGGLVSDAPGWSSRYGFSPEEARRALLVGNGAEGALLALLRALADHATGERARGVGAGGDDGGGAVGDGAVGEELVEEMTALESIFGESYACVCGGSLLTDGDGGCETPSGGCET